ncbi:MAG: hypothetical protein Q8L37_05080 [Candidatus Gottesmanbacteria bacterium]|nr:hypothetical protein [Candidatus Gottesmanbacteria bacterium]
MGLFEYLHNIWSSPGDSIRDPLDIIIQNAQPDELESLLPQLSGRSWKELQKRFEYLFMSTEIAEHGRIADALELCEYTLMLQILDDPDAPPQVRREAEKFAQQIKKLNKYYALKLPEPDDERACIVVNGETLFIDDIFL